MKIHVIIQARMGSERLPGKVMLPLGNTSILDYVVTRSRHIEGIDEVIVATSDLPQDNAIAEWCQLHDTALFRGSEHDVLSRYLACAELYRSDYVVRVTGDCPFLDYVMASDIVRSVQRSPVDMVLIQDENQLTRGLVAEIVSYDALAVMDKRGLEPRHREHVTYYAKEFQSQFRLGAYRPPNYMYNPKLRVTVDTPDDYALCIEAAKGVGANLLVPAEEVVRFLIDNPSVAEMNAHIRQKPVD